MAVLELTKEQIFDLVRQMPAKEKREMLRVLAAGAAERARRRDFAEEQLRRLCAARGLDWDTLGPDEREVFIDDLIHEDRPVRFVAVFDTNVLFSAVGWKGKPFECVELARAGTVDGVTCQELLDELAEKLETKLSFAQDQIVETLADLMTFLRVVSIPGVLKAVLADPDDDKVLECAAVGGATHIVTGDRRHLLPMRNYNGIPIVTAAEFVTVAVGP